VINYPKVNNLSKHSHPLSACGGKRADHPDGYRGQSGPKDSYGGEFNEATLKIISASYQPYAPKLSDHMATTKK